MPWRMHRTLRRKRSKKIIDALRRLSSKYKPYFDALGGDGPTADQERKRVQP
jgi:hypothetical protein